jgi:transcriptional regulator with XRE-family HTH domain
MARIKKAGDRKGPSPIDIEVGRRIRVYRNAAKLSQTDLGNALGLTFQQVQKYEKGTNRVAPSRLEVIAKVCGVPISAFLPSMDGQMGGNSQVLPFDSLRLHGAQDLLAAYSKIKHSKTRVALVALAEAMAKNG